MQARIVAFDRSFDDFGLIYNLGNFSLEIGEIVIIPFGNEEIFGVVLELRETFGELPYEVKNVKGKAFNSIFSQDSIHLLDFVSKRYYTPIHKSLSLFLPKNTREKIIKGKLKIDSKSQFNYKNEEIILTPEQDSVYNSIKKSKNNLNLLHGVTGSGKTHIYIKLIQDYLKEGKQVLLLVPEIILTGQVSKKIMEFFGNDVIIINSSITEAQKTKHFIDISLGKAKIIIGTRSSLFYPYENLGMIIVDEEHDNSYISSESPRYIASEVIEKIVSLKGIKALFSSGTPKVTTMYLAVKGEYSLFTLLNEYEDKESI